MTTDFEKQIDEIRIALYEEMKDMTSAQKANFLNESGRKTAKEFGFTVVKGETGKFVPKASGE